MKPHGAENISAPNDHPVLPELPDYVYEEWHQLAKCKGLDPDIFYPIDPRRVDYVPATKASIDDYERQLTAAKAICDACIVHDECLEYALRKREKHGIWGGKTDRERYNLVRSRIRRRRTSRDQ
ncbi:WhiB family transcriptional regulator [Candidatus Microgenomates bacterium]|nr:WhiB family transcriptional regulator [Candidatus Microgenomates bacterium]